MAASGARFFDGLGQRGAVRIEALEFVSALPTYFTLTMVMPLVIVKPMATVSKSALKAKMLEYFRKVEETGEELIVTDNNEPVLRVVPIRKRVPAATLFADVRGKLVYHEDPLAPTTDEWTET